MNPKDNYHHHLTLNMTITRGFCPRVVPSLYNTDDQLLSRSYVYVGLFWDWGGSGVGGWDGGLSPRYCPGRPKFFMLDWMMNGY